MAALIRRHIEDAGLRRQEILLRRCVGPQAIPGTMWRRQQLLAVDDLQNAVVAYTPCEVDAVADRIVVRSAARQSLAGLRMFKSGDRSMKRVGNPSGSTRLRAHHAVGADVSRVRSEERRVGKECRC